MILRNGRSDTGRVLFKERLLGPVLVVNFKLRGNVKKLEEWLEGSTNFFQVWIFRLGLVEETFSLVELLHLLLCKTDGLLKLPSILRENGGIFKLVEFLDLLEGLLEALNGLYERVFFLVKLGHKNDLLVLNHK